MVNKKRTPKQRRQSAHPWRQGCPTRKLGYPSLFEAEHAATKHRRALGDAWPYKCPKCSDFHLTTQPRRRT